MVSDTHGLILYTDLLFCTAARVLTGAYHLYRDRSPRCLLELHAVAKAEIPIVVVQVANSYKGDAQEFTKTLDRLPQYLAETNPQAVEMLEGQPYLLDLDSLGSDIRGAIPSSQMLTFDPNQSSLAIAGQIQQLGAAMVRQACPENESLLQDLTPTEPEPWNQCRSVAVYIVYAESDPLAIEAATGVKQWLRHRCGLSESAVQLQGPFKTDQTLASDQADSVVMIQTKHVLTEACALSNLYTAVHKHVPIVPIHLTSTGAVDSLNAMYDFDEAFALMEDMQQGLSPEVSAAVETATNQDIAAVGTELLRVVPNIISKRLSAEHSAGAATSKIQLFEIETALRRIAQSSASANQAPKQLQLPEGSPKSR